MTRKNHQEELPGTQQPMSKCQLEAGALIQALEAVNDAQNVVEKRKEKLIEVMEDSRQKVVKVRDAIGRLHEFDLESLTKLKHRKVNDVVVERA